MHRVPVHANNDTGVVQSAEEIAALTRERGRRLHVDAVQTAGKLARRPGDLGADLVTISAHKLYGPKGVGALYVREGTRSRRSKASRRRAGG